VIVNQTEKRLALEQGTVSASLIRQIEEYKKMLAGSLLKNVVADNLDGKSSFISSDTGIFEVARLTDPNIGFQEGLKAIGHFFPVIFRK
jgi:hypothetical protein